jgi:hypothetical protein
MRVNHQGNRIRAAGRRVGIILRFGGVNVRAYAAILRTIFAERLWLVPARIRSPGKESR